MLSPAELPATRRARRGAEWALRAAFIVALVLAVEEALTTMSQRPSLQASGGDGSIRAALREWSSVSRPVKVRLRFDSTPSPVTLAWAAALPGAGTAVSWESSLAPLAMEIEPVADPKRRSRVWIAAPSESRVALADSLGALDSVVVRKFGSSAGPSIVHGFVRGAVDGEIAVTNLSDSLSLRPILVLGRAGWEAKFLVAALEEYGWKVDARLFLSPRNDVVQGSAAPIDTSRYSAVVVVDSSASRYASSIEQYVQRGGGLVAVGEGGTMRGLSGILPASSGEELPPGEFKTADPRRALALRPLVSLKPDAIALEKRGSRVAIAARRVGRGRVVQVGYEDSWRWRMEGRGDPVEDYRNWWSSVVSSAAYAPRIAVVRPESGDPAPIATLVSSLGQPTSGERRFVTGGDALWMLILFIVASGAFVLETASRRVDGKP